MFNTTALDELLRRLQAQLPEGIAAMDADLRKNLRAGLTQVLKDMDLVTREEYELQTRILARTREKLERLEERARLLEHRLEQVLQPPPGPETGTG